MSQVYNVIGFLGQDEISCVGGDNAEECMLYGRPYHTLATFDSLDEAYLHLEELRDNEAYTKHYEDFAVVEADSPLQADRFQLVGYLSEGEIEVYGTSNCLFDVQGRAYRVIETYSDHAEAQEHMNDILDSENDEYAMERMVYSGFAVVDCFDNDNIEQALDND